MTTKFASLIADLDALKFKSVDVSVTSTYNSRNYIYFRVEVKARTDRGEFCAGYDGSNLNHPHIAGEKWAAQYLPKLRDEIVEKVRSRSYRANSNLFRILRKVADEALTAA